MTLTNIIARIKSRIGRSDDTNSTLTDDITYALENVQDEILSDILFPELLSLDTTSLNLLSDTQSYNLPDDFAQPIIFWDNDNFENELIRLHPIEYTQYHNDIVDQKGTNPRYYDILDSALVSSTYRKRIKFFPYPNSLLTGAITAFADYSGTVAGTVLVTDASHGLKTGDSITIVSLSGDYDGSFEITYVSDDTFYITATWTATTTATWTKDHYIPFVYVKSLSYLSSTNTENVISYMYPQLYVEGGAYYMYRDVIYRDNPEKIAFRRTEFERIKKQVARDVVQSDRVAQVVPKRLLGNVQSNIRRLFRTQYSGYSS